MTQTSPRTRLFRNPALAGALAGLALATAAAPAFAEEPARIEIRHADLDLGTADGRAELDRRIDAAAQRLCRTDAATGSRLVDRAALRECVSGVRRQVQGRLAINR